MDIYFVKKSRTEGWHEKAKSLKSRKNTPIIICIFFLSPKYFKKYLRNRENRKLLAGLVSCQASEAALTLTLWQVPLTVRQEPARSARALPVGMSLLLAVSCVRNNQGTEK